MLLTDFLEQFAVPWSKDHKHSRPGWTQVETCENCGSSNYHLGIKDDFSRAACYVCGGKSVRGLLKKLTGAPWKEIYAICGSGDYIAQETETPCGRYTPPTHLVPLSESPGACKYLEHRGFDPDVLEHVWKAQATSFLSDYPFRIFLPIIRKTRPVSWTARAFRDQQPRYQTASPLQKSFPEKEWLFGHDFVKSRAIITEGPFDAINVGPGAVATLGLAVTPAQIKLMADFPMRYVAFDNSEQAQVRADALCETLSVFPGKTVRINLDAEDPGSASRAEIRALRKHVFG
jgi:hypothetical protein